MLVYAPFPHAEIAVVLQEARLGARDGPVRSVGTSASGRAGVVELRIGRTRYRFLKAVRPRCSWDGESWVCWSPELGSEHHGRGETPDSARGDWEQRVHAEFQRLYAKRPFEMSYNERSRWQSLLRVIDVYYYRETASLSLQLIGQVRWGTRPYPSKINWIDGTRDAIRLDRVPPELAGCKPGQWIEADVRREPGTNRLICIDQVRRISTLHRLTEMQLARHWTEMPMADLPESDWEWPAE